MIVSKVRQGGKNNLIITVPYEVAIKHSIRKGDYLMWGILKLLETDTKQTRTINKPKKFKIK